MHDLVLDSRSLVEGVATLHSDDLAEILTGRPTPHDLVRMRRANTIFGHRVTRVGYLYPAFQVDVAAGRVLPFVAKVSRLVARRADDPLLMTWWLSSRAGPSPRQLLAEGADDEVLRLAHERNAARA